MTVAFDPAWARSSFIPIVDNTYDLGAVGLQFRNLYLGTGIISSGSIKVSPSSSETWLFQSTGIRTNVAAFAFVTNTADGADTHSLTLCGGGAYGGTRGSSIILNGNENAGTGSIELLGGSNSNGNIDLRLTDTSAAIRARINSTNLWYIFGTGTILPAANAAYNIGSSSFRVNQFFTYDADVQNGIVLSSSAGFIRTATSDGTDTSELILTGGGAVVSTGNFSRGAQINLAGNEHATRPGEGYFEANSIIRIRVNTGGTVQLQGDNIIFRNNAGTNKWGVVSGDMVYYAASSIIKATTSDASDNSSLFIAGGGDASTGRGSYIGLYGNENGSSGRLDLVSGNVSGSYILINASLAASSIRHQIAGSAIHRTVSDGILFEQTTNSIGTNTSDASDTASLFLCGGGTYSTTRGAIIELYGNENGVPGALKLTSGNVANSYIQFSTSIANAPIISKVNATEIHRTTATAIQFALANALICTNTVDGSDNSILTLSGGGDAGSARGAFVAMYGNENASPGYLVLSAGNVGGGTINFNTSALTRWVLDANGAFKGNIAGSNIISTNTSDAADSSYLSIAGGGAVGNARGGYIQVRGNEAANGGIIYIEAGNVSTGNIEFYTQTVRRFYIDYSGILYSDATNGAGIILARTGVNLAPILSGASTLDADVTALSSTHYGLAIVQSATVSPSTVFIANGADSNGSQMMFFKTRATAPGTDANTIVASGDQISTFLFGGADGAAYKYAAQITAGIDGTPGTNDMPGYLLFRVTADGSASPSDALKIGNDRVLTINNCVAAPSGTPTTSGYLYVESGALKYKGSSGTVTTVANA